MAESTMSTENEEVLVNLLFDLRSAASLEATTAQEKSNPDTKGLLLDSAADLYRQARALHTLLQINGVKDLGAINY